MPSANPCSSSLKAESGSSGSKPTSLGRVAPMSSSALCRIRMCGPLQVVVSMVDLSEVTAVVLAAGLSRRFGRGDKLLHPIQGRPLASHIANTLRSLPLRARIVVWSNVDVAHIFSDFIQIRNTEPERGMGHSLSLGLSKARTSHVLVCLADMPFVTASHLTSLIQAAVPDDHRHVATFSAGYLGPPALLEMSLLASQTFDGDKGARALLFDARQVEAPTSQIVDVDHIQDV